MSPATATPANVPVGWADPGVRRITVEHYHRMGEAGLWTPDDRVELLEGLIVDKPMKNPPHTVANGILRRAIDRLAPPGWIVRTQDPITLDDSEPEPDLVLTRGSDRDFLGGHPTPADIALVVEVSETSLSRDREWKKRVYARNGIPVYWIVNLVDRLVEVYTDPSGPVLTPDYATATILGPADAVDVTVAGAVVGSVAVADLLP